MSSTATVASTATSLSRSKVYRLNSANARQSLKRETSSYRSEQSRKDEPFAHLPPYSPPSTGLVSKLPLSLVPYAELMRLHKPAGFYAFYFPHIIGTLFAAAVLPSAPSPSAIASTALLHIAGNLVLRGGACTYNDALDGPFDRQVARCRHRPVARGAVSPVTAHGFAAVQTAAWMAVLAVLPRDCLAPAALFALTMVVYPWCKRFTNFPQVVLGFSLALGQSIGMASLGLDPFVQSELPVLQGAMLCLYLANVVNAVVYDTVYAHQDLKDDLKAGVMGMAVACGGRTKEVLSVLSAVEIALLAAAGHLAGFGPAYWVAGVAGTAAILAWMIRTVDVEDPADCWKWFCWLIWFTGSALCAGLAGEYAMRLL